MLLWLMLFVVAAACLLVGILHLRIPPSPQQQTAQESPADALYLRRKFPCIYSQQQQKQQHIFDLTAVQCQAVAHQPTRGTTAPPIASQAAEQPIANHQSPITNHQSCIYSGNVIPAVHEVNQVQSIILFLAGQPITGHHHQPPAIANHQSPITTNHHHASIPGASCMPCLRLTTSKPSFCYNGATNRQPTINHQPSVTIHQSPNTTH